MRRANTCLEASRPEITQCLSMHGFQKGVKFPARIPRNRRADGGDITVEWQRKSQEFMEIVKLKGFSIELGRENTKDFDLVGK